MSAVFFDLDGTLWDAAESTARAWTEVFGRRGIGDGVGADAIRRVAGKPYAECLQIVAPQAAETPDRETLLAELSDAEQRWMYALGGRLYPGVAEGLAGLAARHDLFLVSNCNAWYLEAFLERSGTRRFFSDATCLGITGLPKARNLEALKGKHGIRTGAYVGDTQGDREAALAASLEYLHVDYGFGGGAVQARHRFADFASVVAFLLREAIRA